MRDASSLHRVARRHRAKALGYMYEGCLRSLFRRSSFIYRLWSSHMQRLQNKVALVTAAASGIGRATALRFAAEGAQVVALDRSAEGLADTVATIATAGGQALDVT